MSMSDIEAEYIRRQVKAAMLNQSLPVHMEQSVSDYLEFGLPPGGFLTGVLANDFKRAATAADHINVSRLYDWAIFMCSIPQILQGSYDRVEAWCSAGGLRGLTKPDSRPPLTDDEGLDDG